MELPSFPVLTVGSSQYEPSADGLELGGVTKTDQTMFYGIIINLFGNVSINVGTNLWRYGGLAKIPGFILIGGGNIMNFISFALAPQALLSALSSIQFVTNVFLSWGLFSEKPSARSLAGTAVIVIADLLIAFSGLGADSGSSKEGVKHLLQLYWQGPARRIFSWAIYAAFTLLFFLFCWSYECSPLPFQIPGTRRCASCRTIGVQDLEKLNRSVLPAFLFVNLSATIGASSVVQGKVVSLELRYMSMDKGGLWAPGFMGFVKGNILMDILAVIVFFLFMGGFWIVQLGRALRFFRGPFLIPLQQACWIFWTILGGAVTFEEFAHLTTETAFLFFGGVLILFSGVLLMSPPPRRPVGSTAGEGHHLDARMSTFAGEGAAAAGTGWVSSTGYSDPDCYIQDRDIDEAEHGGSSWYNSMMAPPVASHSRRRFQSESGVSDLQSVAQSWPRPSSIVDERRRSSGAVSF
mmetsp:Transcript_35319/g.75266  ORF Transcript_35319/g.75266 Transcript_35319/m.75266 type:complete len:465 (-) Transcript_35319:147-1541(-)